MTYRKRPRRMRLRLQAHRASLRLDIRGYGRLDQLTWRPEASLNVILGGGDVGKSTVLDAVGLLLSPSNPTTLAETDYYRRASTPALRSKP